MKKNPLSTSNAFRVYSGRNRRNVFLLRTISAAYAVFAAYLAINITRAALLEQAAYNNDLPAGQKTNKENL